MPFAQPPPKHPTHPLACQTLHCWPEVWGKFLVWEDLRKEPPWPSWLGSGRGVGEVAVSGGQRSMRRHSAGRLPLVQSKKCQWQEAWHANGLPAVLKGWKKLSWFALLRFFSSVQNLKSFSHAFLFSFFPPCKRQIPAQIVLAGFSASESTSLSKTFWEQIGMTGRGVQIRPCHLNVSRFYCVMGGCESSLGVYVLPCWRRSISMSECNAIASYSLATTFLSQIPQASDVPVNK